MTTTPEPLPDDQPVDVLVSAEQATVSTVSTPVEVVRISRRIVTETVQVPVQVRREELVVTRSPADRDSELSASTGMTATGERPALVIPLRHEVPAVGVTVVATEQVIVRVLTITTEQAVSTELQRENVEVLTGAADGPGAPLSGQR